MYHFVSVLCYKSGKHVGKQIIVDILTSLNEHDGIIIIKFDS